MQHEIYVKHRTVVIPRFENLQNTQNVTKNNKKIKLKIQKIPLDAVDEKALIATHLMQDDYTYLKELLNYMWRQKDPIPVITKLRLLGFSMRQIELLTGLPKSTINRKLKDLRKKIEKLR